jgi:hypothetical protein
MPPLTLAAEDVMSAAEYSREWDLLRTEIAQLAGRADPDIASQLRFVFEQMGNLQLAKILTTLYPPTMARPYWPASAGGRDVAEMVDEVVWVLGLILQVIWICDEQSRPSTPSVKPSVVPGPMPAFDHTRAAPFHWERSRLWHCAIHALRYFYTHAHSSLIVPGLVLDIACPDWGVIAMPKKPHGGFAYVAVHAKLMPLALPISFTPQTVFAVSCGFQSKLGQLMLPIVRGRACTDAGLVVVTRSAQNGSHPELDRLVPKEEMRSLLKGYATYAVSGMHGGSARSFRRSTHDWSTTTEVSQARACSHRSTAS